MLNDQEIEALREFSAGLWGIYKLPVAHPKDLQDIEFHVHAIQNIVMARSAARSHPEEFNYAPDFK